MSTTTEDATVLPARKSAKPGLISAAVNEKQTRDLRHNLGRSIGDAASFGAMVGLGETYLPAFALALGMGETSAGLVASLPLVAGGIMQLVSLRAMKSCRQRTTLGGALRDLSGIIADSLGHRRVVRFDQHATFDADRIGLLGFGTSQRSGVEHVDGFDRTGGGAGPLFFSPLKTAAIVDIDCAAGQRRVPAGSPVRRMGIAWVCSLVLCGGGRGDVVSVACLATHRSDRRLAGRSLSRLSQKYSGHVSRSGRRLLVYLVVVQACVQISGPFFAPFMLKQLGFSYFEFVYLLAVAFVARSHCDHAVDTVCSPMRGTDLAVDRCDRLGPVILVVDRLGQPVVAGARSGLHGGRLGGL